MTATLDDEIVDLRRAIAELQRTLNEALAERDESLRRETATAEVLGVINSSPGDLAPVFDAMLETALRVCQAAFGFIASYDGEHFHTVAERGLSPAFAEVLRTPYRPPKGAPAQRLIDGEAFVQIADILEEEGTVQGLTPVRRALVETARGRAFLTVALRKESVLIGSIMIYRQEVRPFSDKQIALLQNFAAQAVIAMENARLLSELRERTHDLEESLEYQTATSNVLQVISRSTFDLQPVLDTVCNAAARLAAADLAHIATRDGDVYRPIATFAISPEFAQATLDLSFTPGRGTVVGRALPQRSRRVTPGSVRRKAVEPRPVSVLQIEKLADRIAPPLRHAAPVSGPAISQPRGAIRMRRPVARLPLRHCHRFSRRLRPALHRSPKPPLRNAVIWVRVELWRSPGGRQRCASLVKA